MDGSEAETPWTPQTVSQGEWAGWGRYDTDPFETLTGPFYARRGDDGRMVCAFRAEPRHMNGGGFMHGGCMATFADYAIFMFAETELAGSGSVTAQLTTEFLDSARAHIRLVDRAIGIPIMLYNYPGRTGVDMKPDDLERLAELKNVATSRRARARRCGSARSSAAAATACRSFAAATRWCWRASSWRRRLGGRNCQRLRGGARPLVRTAAVQRLCGRPRIFLPSSTAAFADRGQRQVHAIGQGRRRPGRSRCWPPAAAPAAAY